MFLFFDGFGYKNVTIFITEMKRGMNMELVFLYVNLSKSKFIERVVLIFLQIIILKLIIKMAGMNFLKTSKRKR